MGHKGASFEGNGMEDRGWSESFYLGRCLDPFSMPVAKRILCIPLPLFEQENSLIWRRGLSGEYSVRIGHKIVLHEGRNQIQADYIQLYKKLWKLDLPLKLKLQFGDFCVTMYLLSVIYTIEECWILLRVGGVNLERRQRSICFVNALLKEGCMWTDGLYRWDRG